jgi:hypothetical protein
VLKISSCRAIIECTGSAGKKVNIQAQRERASEEAKAKAMDRWGQSPTYTASRDPQEIERSPFRGQRSRSQNRSLVRGWGEREGKEVRKQPPKAPFSAAFSQVSRQYLVLPSVVAHSPSSLEADHGIRFRQWATAIRTPERPRVSAG